MNRTCVWTVLWAATLVAVIFQPLRADDDGPASTPGTLDATHSQTMTLKPTHDGKPIHLNTFCLDAKGNILAAVGNGVAAPASRSAEPPAPVGYVQFYSPEWKLIREIPLDFVPTALNVDDAGYLYVGGNSVVCKLREDGSVVQRAPAPNLGDPEQMRQQAKAQLIAQGEQSKRSIESMLNQAKAALKARADDDGDDDDGDDDDGDDNIELPESHPFRSMPLEQLRSTIQSYETYLEQNAAQFEPNEARIDAMLKNMGRINSLAVGTDDVFVVCTSTAGFGYEIWRMTRELQEPAMIMDRLSGCCGQMDIQAQGEKLIVAENTKFRVGIYDRDGKPISTFGKQDRRGEEGFGSCCNPMNTRCCSNGDILTAESSIGTIKRFDADGNLLATVGRAKIGGGCKHVALGFDSSRDRYYMMYQDESSICVLEPASADREETEEERSAREAAEGLGKWLQGTWGQVDAAQAAANERDANLNTIASIYGFSKAKFAADGEMTNEPTMEGRALADQLMKWIPVSQKEQELVIGVEINLVNSYNLIVRFENERRAEFLLQYGGRGGSATSLGIYEKIEE